MNSVFQHPAVQVALLPAFISVIVIALFAKRFPQTLGFIGLLLFVITILFVNGTDLVPLTSSRKIMLLVLVSGLFILLLNWVPFIRHSDPIRRQKKMIIITAVGISISIIWIMWPVVSRQEEIYQAISMLIVYVLFSAWIVGSSYLTQLDVEKRYASLLALSFGTGLSALIGASALYGQLILPFASLLAVALGFYLFTRVKPNIDIACEILLKSAVALIGSAAVVYSNMHWLCLIPLAMIPLAAIIPVKRATVPWVAILQRLIVAHLFAGLAIALAVYYAGPVPY